MFARPRAWALALAACSGGGDTGGPPGEAAGFTVVTFNTGTSPDLDHDAPPEDGYTSAEAAVEDTWYGNGLAWLPAVEAAADWMAEQQPDLVAFQEIFWPGDCAAIPEEARAGFVCEDWEEGDPVVAQAVLGEGWQVLCNPGHPDKCLGVRRSFGAVEGCEDDLCIEGMEGWPVEGCGSGARIGRAVVDRADGTRLTVVTVHGTSGWSADEKACRVAQFEQIWVDLGDGSPGADGAANVVLGDFNTDPGRLAEADPSAARVLDFAAPPEEAAGDRRFRFLTEVGPDAEPTYQGLLDIDHVIADAFTGDCGAGGLGELPAVWDGVLFDHRPILCELHPE